MNTLGYNVLALVLVVGAVVLSTVSIVKELAVTDVIAISAPLLGLAGTIAGRGASTTQPAHNDSAQGH